MYYRREHVKGGSYFFTLNLQDRGQTTLIDYIDDLRQVVSDVKRRHPFNIDAMVVLPEHLHIVMTLPIEDDDYPNRISLIKSGFSRKLPKLEILSKSRKKKGERGIWQRRYWEHLIKDAEDYKRHVDYIHFNPVKHEYVNKASDWQYSSIHRYIREGTITEDWASNLIYTPNEEFGE